LELGRKDLLKRQVLRLVHPGAGHGYGRYAVKRSKSKQLPRREPFRNRAQQAEIRREYDLLSREANRIWSMKSLGFIVILSLALLVSGPAAEAPDARQVSEQVLVLVKEVQGQQAMIADNQAKIDAKLATIAEAIRVARIYSGRGGR
jgi:hypothetical protein